MNNIPSGLSFQSSSYGIGAICKPASPYNDTSWDNQTNWPDQDVYGGYALFTIDGITLPNQFVNLSLRTDLTLNIESSIFDVLTLQDSEGHVFGEWGPGEYITNPFVFVQMMVWGTTQTDGSDYFILGNNADYDFGITWFIGGCNMSVYDIELTYMNGTYALASRSLADENTTTMFLFPFIGTYFNSYFGPRMVVNLGSQLNNNNTDFLVEVAYQASQLNMGLSAGMFTPTAAVSNVTMEKIVIASSYPLNALSMLWVATALYLALGFGLLITSLREQGDILSTDHLAISASDSLSVPTSTLSTLVLAQQRMVTPFALVAEHFVLPGHGGNHPDGLAPALSIQGNVMDMFLEAKDEERLGIGYKTRLSPETNEERMGNGIFSVGYLTLS
jgi:hypothetical protein